VAAENDNTTDRFELDGVEYEVPDFMDLTIEDWEIVYDEAKVVLADFAPIFDDTPLEERKTFQDAKPAEQKKMRERFAAGQRDAKEAEAARLEKLKNPRVEKAFLMIAYLRAHPDEDVATARALVGKARLIAMIEAAQSEDDAADPTSATEQERSSPRSEDDSNESSSLPSQPSSDTPADELATTSTVG